MLDCEYCYQSSHQALKLKKAGQVIFTTFNSTRRCPVSLFTGLREELSSTSIDFILNPVVQNQLRAGLLVYIIVLVVS